MRQLHWGAAWLELLFSREAVAGERETRERMQTALISSRRLSVKTDFMPRRWPL